MKLVHDADDNVTPLEIANLSDIPDRLRELANDIEAGECGELDTVYVMLIGNGLSTEYYGEALSRYELIGVLEHVKLTAFDD